MNSQKRKLELAPIFQRGMVLQRGKPLKIWGKADPNKSVIVNFQGHTSSVESNQLGEWAAELPPAYASLNEVMKVTTEDCELLVEDIAVGEVFVAGGQSNMQFLMRYEKHREETVLSCENDRIRFYDVPKIAYDGQDLDFDYSCVGIWRKASPENLDYFSAVGYYFAREIENVLDVPVGIIGCNWGGTSASSWMKKDSAERLCRPELQRFREMMKEIPPENYRAFFGENPINDRGLSHWSFFDDFFMPRTPAPDEIRAFFENSTMPSGGEFVNVVLPEHNPGSLFQHMVLSIAGMAVSGILWYQGESDDNPDAEAIRYADSMKAVVSDWRNAWGQMDLPFFVVQLPGFGRWLEEKSHNYSVIRKDQELVSDEDENIYLCSISDAGEQFDIHPKDKRTVGMRLALLAEKYLYGINVCADPPVLDQAQRNGNRIILSFRNGEGLRTKGDQIEALEVYWGEEPALFEAYVEEERIIVEVSCSESSDLPIKVMFAQTPWFKVNLYNAAMLPVVPFSVTV